MPSALTVDSPFGIAVLQRAWEGIKKWEFIAAEFCCERGVKCWARTPQRWQSLNPWK